jgi:hypothetical protein
MAREAPTAVIFRRGPSRWVRLIRWNVADDSFELGQWFKGRIYEKRSDLSPDGTKLVYFAQKINSRTVADAKVGYAWTAVSRPPYLTAIGLWSKGDCWNGGGLFEKNDRLLLNHPTNGTRHDREPKGLTVVRRMLGMGEDDTVLDPRLTRDGWTLTQVWRGHFHESASWTAIRELVANGLSPQEIVAKALNSKLHELANDSGYVTELPEVRERTSPDGRSVIRMEMSHWEFQCRYAFSVCEENAEPVSVDEAEWADWDQRGRVAFVRHGKVLVMDRKAGGRWEVVELADLNDQRPERLKCPEWASRW